MDNRGNPKPGEMQELAESKQTFDPFTTELLLREAYETDFGICDHRLPENQGPMNLVRMNPKEDPSSYSPLYETLRRYTLYRIKDHFGYKPHEFLALPREYVRLLFQIAMEETQRKTVQTREVLNELEQGAKS